jgi:hypothetical protein
MGSPRGPRYKKKYAAARRPRSVLHVDGVRLRSRTVPPDGARTARGYGLPKEGRAEADFKVPREVIIVPELPRSTLNEVSRKDLRAWLAARTSAPEVKKP